MDTKIVKRIESICHEFDARAESLGVAFARLELAKALAKSEERLTRLITGLNRNRTTRKNP